MSSDKMTQQSYGGTNTYIVFALANFRRLFVNVNDVNAVIVIPTLKLHIWLSALRNDQGKLTRLPTT